MEIKICENCDCQVKVINLFEGGKTSNELVNEYAVEKDDFKGKFLDTYILHTYGKYDFDKILVVGFGKKEEFNPDKLRELSAKTVKKLNAMRVKRACFDFDGVDFDMGKSIAQGALIGEYSFDKYKTKKAEKHLETLCINKNATQENIIKGIKSAEAMSFARNLANEPAQYATPSKLAEIAKSIEGIETRIYEASEIPEMGAFLAVGRGSAEAPKFIHMKYSCSNPTKKIAIIGKGITFDSGGMDIKPASSMLNMKDDMSGAACVLSVMKTLKEFNPQIEVHGIIAACENMVSGNSYKPGDVLTAKNGKTIEVDNTDAEGRLTLADALCFACELGVDEVIDIATLTGACMVALGSQAAGIMGNDDKLIDELIKSAQEAGERYWKLPLYEEFKDYLKSEVADMRNTGTRNGGASCAGVFLKNFVKDVKWAHIDIAGVAFLDKAQKELPKGATGAGVRALLEYITG
jgi:leucyl aminopeptidase